MSIQSLVGEGHYFEETVTPERIRELLNKSSTETRSGAMEKTEGMKYLLAQMSKGRDVSEYYADVVRNVIVQSVDVKKLVYTYLVYHADANDTCRELALLAINTFQKDLSNRNELIRALALRVMCGIRVQDIIAIQVMTVKKAAFDTSPYVRKVAALCLPKVFSMDPATGEELTEVVERLLHDRATIVLSSSVFAWREVCPTRYDMLHSVYRKLAHTLADLDEWGQVMTLQVLTEYARTQFVDPRTGAAALREAVAARRAVKAAKPKKKKSGFYSDESSVTASDGEGEEGGGWWTMGMWLWTQTTTCCCGPACPFSPPAPQQWCWRWQTCTPPWPLAPGTPASRWGRR